LSAWLREQLAVLPEQPDDAAEAANGDLVSLLTAFANDASVQMMLAEALADEQFSPTAKRQALAAIAAARLGSCSPALPDALAGVVNQQALAGEAIAAARALPPQARRTHDLASSLLAVAINADAPRELRIAAMAAAGPLELNDELFGLLMEGIAPASPIEVRSAAVEALGSTTLAPTQLEQLAVAMKTTGPLEINRLLTPFEKTTDATLGMALVEALQSADALSSLRVDRLREALAGCGPEVQAAVDELETLVNVDAAAQRARIDELLPQLAGGDVRRGHAVFYSAKAACSACHKLANAGGTAGPELTGLGEARTERDFLESILYPSLSFVRSYEPVVAQTVDGQTINGVIRDETEEGYLLATGPNQEVRIAREDVEEIQPSNVSIMPAGLDKQLSVQELADLVAFLKSAKR
jgi:putative heme-binding domain-containing protein